MDLSMADGHGSCQRAGSGALDELRGFRRGVYRCLWRRPDALFETMEAVLTARPGVSLPYLSLEPVMRRGHGMVYQGLAEGRIDEEAMRDLLVASRPRDWPLAFAIDASTIARPAAVTSPGREFHHYSCECAHGKDGAAVAGWAFQWLSQLCFDGGSWTAPHDQVRAGAGDDPSRQAVTQIVAHAARLRAGGEDGVPLYVLDAGYDEAAITWDLRDHLDRVQVLVRVRNDRVLYRDPLPRQPHRAGRPAKYGPRFECKDPATWGAPDQELSLHDQRYGQVSVMCWGGLHPLLQCRGRFAGLAGPPLLTCHLIRVTVTRLPHGRTVPGPLWLWWAGPGTPDLNLIWRAYLHRSGIEHSYRFVKHTLGWATPAVRDPDQFSRWTWLIISAYTQLRLARRLAEDNRMPWERPRRPARLTPGRVRRDFPRLLPLTGTPARPPKSTTAGPGRPKGRTSTPAPRYPATRKAA